jgi:hypothetical protein
MGLVLVIVIVVVLGSVAAAAGYLRHELRPIPFPSRLYGGKAVRVAPGDECVCGGMIGKSGKTSKRFGDLLGCTACSRSWTMDGRRIRHRRPGAASQAPGNNG